MSFIDAKVIFVDTERLTLDAIATDMSELFRDVENQPQFLIKADIRACYASISHRWLLKYIPMDTGVLMSFSKQDM